MYVVQSFITSKELFLFTLLSAVSMSAVGATARLEYKYHTPIHRLCFINIVSEKRKKTFPELRSLSEE